MARRGRNRKQGERYPGGKLKTSKPTGEPLAPALWDRIKRDVIARASDPRAGSEVGRLNMNRELTSSHVVAAFKVAEIYGAFEKLEGINRSSRSASYETGRGKGGVDEMRLTKDELAKLIDKQDGIKTAFLALGRELSKYPKWMRDVLERLCVEDRSVLPVQLESVRTMLDNLVTFFGSRRGAPRKPKSENQSRQVLTVCQ